MTEQEHPRARPDAVDEVLAEQGVALERHDEAVGSGVRLTVIEDPKGRGAPFTILRQSDGTATVEVAGARTQIAPGAVGDQRLRALLSALLIGRVTVTVRRREVHVDVRLEDGTHVDSLRTSYGRLAGTPEAQDASYSRYGTALSG